MDYIQIVIEFPDAEVEAYQEVSTSGVVGYKALDGTFLFAVIPAGIASRVVDANPPRESWML